jgi:hypothetical protein
MSLRVALLERVKRDAEPRGEHTGMVAECGLRSRRTRCYYFARWQAERFSMTRVLKLEAASTQPRVKRRSQFRTASRDGLSIRSVSITVFDQSR